LACPYFIPREILNDGSWLHPGRLPLGAGWTGSCGACEPEVSIDPAHVRDFCNLGYAVTCPHLPQQRDWDAVRFSVARAGTEQITLVYACELKHAPVKHGTLTFDLLKQRWLDPHPDARVDRLATSYLRAYRERTTTIINPL
jgi:hypothetical protein